MFERFTERARQVVVLAQEEACAFKHNYIGTEHLLLGMLREKKGLAARTLESLDISIERVRAQVVQISPEDEEVIQGQLPFTPRAKKVLELALREALHLGHTYIGTEHVLLGLVRENEGVAARILLDFDADAEKIRNEVMRVLGGGASSTASSTRPVQPPQPPEPRIPNKPALKGLLEVHAERATLKALEDLPGVTVKILSTIVVGLPSGASRKGIESLVEQLQAAGWVIDPESVLEPDGSIRAL